MRGLIEIHVCVNDVIPTWMPKTLVENMTNEIDKAASEFTDKVKGIRERYEEQLKAEVGQNVLPFRKEGT